MKCCLCDSPAITITLEMHSDHCDLNNRSIVRFCEHHAREHLEMMWGLESESKAEHEPEPWWNQFQGRIGGEC